ncbi:MAG: cupin domain-containing protein [Candidatus Levyibacteriota bacterium]
MFIQNIKEEAKNNTNFRKVIYTGKNSQLVLMSLLKGEDIGMETHPTTDQIICIVEGDGKAILNGEEKNFSKHNIVFVPAGTEHNFINTGGENLKLYTIYAPPAHKDGTIHATKEDAQKEEKY